MQTLLRSDARARLLEAGLEPATDGAVPLAQEIRLHADLVKAAGLVPR